MAVELKGSKRLKDFKVGMRITVSDKMQKGYKYELEVPVGKKFDDDFKPELTPAQMLKMGVFALSSNVRHLTRGHDVHWDR